MSQITTTSHDLSQAAVQLTEHAVTEITQSGSCQPGVVRLAIPIESIDMLGWLSAQSNDIKLYWRGRQNSNQMHEMAGIGAAHRVTALSAPIDFGNLTRRILQTRDKSGQKTCYYGGIQFHTDRDHPDAGRKGSFPAACFVLPLVEAVSCEGQTELACNLVLPSQEPEKQIAEIRQALSKLKLPDANWKTEIPTVIGRHDQPDHQTWNNRVSACLAEIENSLLEKIVLARRTTFRFTRPLDPWQLVDDFRAEDGHRFLFGFQLEPGTAFITASPESLYSRVGAEIHTEALAGTRKRGIDSADDARRGDKLISSIKERHEQALVSDQINAALATVCDNHSRDAEVTLLKLKHVQHLVTKFEGRLKDGVREAQLLELLHPSPAVGGHPRKLALESIHNLETFDRGWYAGPIGWIGDDSAEFCVGIRSGVVESERLSLYSGAGIVTGSVPENEWKEIENKIAGFLALITR